MKKSTLIYCTLLLLSVCHISAQIRPNSGTFVYYFDDNDRIVQSRDSAKYFRRITNLPSKIETKDYFLSGDVKRTAPSILVITGCSDGIEEIWYENGNKMSELAIVGGNMEGIYKEWHENGKLRLTANFNAGMVDGEAIAYHSNEQIMRKVVFKNGKEVNCTCFSENGNPEVCTGLTLQIASFGNDITDLMKYLQNNIRYPAVARRKSIQGTIYVGFMIDMDGTVRDPHIIRSVNTDLDMEALAVIEQMPKWQPSIKLGQPSRTMFILPVRFALR